MRALTRTLAAGSLAAGALLASPADAACLGTAETVFVCVPSATVYPNPITQCVYLLSDECEDVTVPFYSVRLYGDLSCGGEMYARLYPDNLVSVC